MEDKEKNTPVKSKGTEVNKQRQLFVEWSSGRVRIDHIYLSIGLKF